MTDNTYGCLFVSLLLSVGASFALLWGSILLTTDYLHDNKEDLNIAWIVGFLITSLALVHTTIYSFIWLIKSQV